jgi:hypothetical protein
LALLYPVFWSVRAPGISDFYCIWVLISGALRNRNVIRGRQSFKRLERLATGSIKSDGLFPGHGYVKGLQMDRASEVLVPSPGGDKPLKIWHAAGWIIPDFARIAAREFTASGEESIQVHSFRIVSSRASDGKNARKVDQWLNIL